MLNLIAIKTPTTYFISEQSTSDYNRAPLESYIFDGTEKVLPTFHPHWFSIKVIPVKIEREERQPNTNYRFELIDPSFESSLFLRTFVCKDVADWIDYEWVWKPEYAKLRSLYKLVSDPQPSVLVEVPFKLNLVLELQEELLPSGAFSYSVPKTQYRHEGMTAITEKDVKYQIIDQIVFPNIVLPTKPCKLSSLQTYNIIREHVKSNIKSSVAEITSDYDFCFTVKKKIKLVEPEKFTVDVNNSLFSSRKKKPKLETRFNNTRAVTIFEMTHDKAAYKEYPIIEGFKGENHLDLKEKIDFYLESLMDVINSPIEDCVHCSGRGVIINNQIPKVPKD